MKTDVEEEAIPSHSEVHDMLTKCLPWVEQQPETTATHVYLQELAAGGCCIETFQFKNNLIFFLIILILVKFDYTYILNLRTYKSPISFNNRRSTVY